MDEYRTRENYERFDQFISGMMNDGEMESFQNDLQKNRQLQNEFDLFKLTSEAINLSSFRNAVSAANSRHKQGSNEGRQISIFRLSMRIAAGLVLLLISLFAYQFISVDKNEVYESMYVSYKLPITRSEGQPSTLELSYQEKEFEQTIIDFKALETPSVRDYFLTAAAHLELGNSDESIKLFREVVAKNASSSEKLFVDETEFYLILAYIKAGSYKEALSRMETIQNNESHLFHQNVTDDEIDQVKKLLLRERIF